MKFSDFHIEISKGFYCFNAKFEENGKKSKITVAIMQSRIDKKGVVGAVKMRVEDLSSSSRREHHQAYASYLSDLIKTNEFKKEVSKARNKYRESSGIQVL